MKTPIPHAIALALSAFVSLCGCAKASTTQNAATEAHATPPWEKALVVCFSATGNTRGVAQRLAAAIGADFVEITPAQPYSPEDLDWRNKESRTSREMADRKSRPAIATAFPRLGEYETIFLGFPIWWGREPSIIDTFVESNAGTLAGKTIVPFATSGSSGMGDTTANLQALAPQAKVLPGRRFPVKTDGATLGKWAGEIGKE